MTTDFGGPEERAKALVLQLDGKLVTAGLSNASGAFDFALARYLPDGRLDPTFGVGGQVTTDFGGTADVAFALVLQPDGKLVTAGQSNASGEVTFALARYLPDGRLDPTFGVGDQVTTDFAAFSALVHQPDGKLVAAGFSSQGDGDFAPARYESLLVLEVAIDLKRGRAKRLGDHECQGYDGGAVG